mmetsp:Transcript_67448/g.109370  ORF Transcript_67448/g.109370 Transcript_67448/m.109370 type:complete len:118 (+) Transcript_67448:83-436(+)
MRDKSHAQVREQHAQGDAGHARTKCTRKQGHGTRWHTLSLPLTTFVYFCNRNIPGDTKNNGQTRADNVLCATSPPLMSATAVMWVYRERARTRSTGNTHTRRGDGDDHDAAIHGLGG